MKLLKFTANLLSITTIFLFLFLLTLFLKSITVVESTAQYTDFGIYFWVSFILLLLLNVFTDLQMIFEKSLSRFKIFKSKDE